MGIDQKGGTEGDTDEALLEAARISCVHPSQCMEYGLNAEIQTAGAQQPHFFVGKVLCSVHDYTAKRGHFEVHRKMQAPVRTPLDGHFFSE